jgi:hypothetical protein
MHVASSCHPWPCCGFTCPVVAPKLLAGEAAGAPSAGVEWPGGPAPAPAAAAALGAGGNGSSAASAPPAASLLLCGWSAACCHKWRQHQLSAHSASQSATTCGYTHPNNNTPRRSALGGQASAWYGMEGWHAHEGHSLGAWSKRKHCRQQLAQASMLLLWQIRFVHACHHSVRRPRPPG